MTMLPEDSQSGPNDPESTVLERVQELTWALLDEDLSDDDMSLLDTLLLSDDKARRVYMECVQLHVDLMGHFAESKTSTVGAVGSQTPVLGFLKAEGSSLDVSSPRVAE